MAAKSGGGSFFRAAPAPAPLAPAQGSGLIGVVCDDIEKAADYLSVPIGPYVIIRTAADVPKQLGGVAILSTTWPAGLADALARACGLTA